MSLIFSTTLASLPLAEFPPLHPIFVNFTAALLPTSFFFDLLGTVFHRPTLRDVAWWTLVVAACLTPLTVLFGWLWFGSMRDMDHWQMSYHMWLGTAIGLGVLVMVAWRGLFYKRASAPSAAYALVAAVIFVALLAQGDLGGSMSFESGIVFSSGHHHPEEEESSHSESKAGQDDPLHSEPSPAHAAE